MTIATKSRKKGYSALVAVAAAAAGVLLLSAVGTLSLSSAQIQGQELLQQQQQLPEQLLGDAQAQMVQEQLQQVEEALSQL